MTLNTENQIVDILKGIHETLQSDKSEYCKSKEAIAIIGIDNVRSRSGFLFNQSHSTQNTSNNPC